MEMYLATIGGDSGIPLAWILGSVAVLALVLIPVLIMFLNNTPGEHDDQ